MTAVRATTTAQVVALPTAASAPVVNARLRGRAPAGVVPQYRMATLRNNRRWHAADASAQSVIAAGKVAAQEPAQQQQLQSVLRQCEIATLLLLKSIGELQAMLVQPDA